MTSTFVRTILSVVLLCAAAPLLAATFFVSANAAAGGDGSPERPLRTLALAQKASAPGDSIAIVRGTGPYREGIVLKERQTLSSTSEPAKEPAPLIDNPQGETIVMSSGSTVAGVRAGSAEHAAIGIRGATDVTIRDVALELSSAARGIVIANAAQVVLRDAKIVHQPLTSGARGDACRAGAAIEPLACGSSVQLHQAENVTIERVVLADAPHLGIRGEGVRGLTLTDVQIRGAGDEHGEHGARLRDLTGTLRIARTRFERNESRQLHLIQESGEAAIEVVESFFGGGPPPNGQQAILVQTSGDARLRLAVTGSTFAENFGTAVQINVEGASVVTTEIAGNTFRKGGAAVSALAANTASLTYRIATNSIQQSSATALNVHATTSAAVSGEIVENVIGTAGKAGSGAACGGGCSGIAVTALGRGTSSAVISQNTVHQADSNGILARAGGDATLDVRITGNTIGDPSGRDALHAIAVVAGMRKNDRAAVCAEIGGAGALVNSVSGSWNAAGGGAAIGLTRRGDATSLSVARYAGERTNVTGLSKFVAGANRGAAVQASIGSGVTLSDGCVSR